MGCNSKIFPKRRNYPNGVVEQRNFRKPFLSPMALVLLILLVLSVPSASDASVSQSDIGYISSVISESGLAFAKDLLVERAIDSLIPLRLHDIEKSVHIPLIGWVHIRAANITLSSINVSSSTVKPGESGIVIVASGATASLSFDWLYSYSTWLIPIEISDKGRAFVQVPWKRNQVIHRLYQFLIS